MIGHLSTENEFVKVGAWKKAYKFVGNFGKSGGKIPYKFIRLFSFPNFNELVLSAQMTIFITFLLFEKNSIRAFK